MDSSNRFIYKESPRAFEEAREAHKAPHQQHTGTVYTQATCTEIAIVEVDGRCWPAPTCKKSQTNSAIAAKKKSCYFDRTSFYRRHKEAAKVQPQPHAARRHDIC
mmetsp:Transcript_27751/g.65141  ORF Transcript_27751/g.65141 Transcript_27751/m.65141 type:complete len:105 (+) Transcript_27751:287-601(+)